MGKVVSIGDTPETIADRRARQTRLRQLITVGNALVGQRDAFKGKLTKRELILRHQLDTSARGYRDEAIGMLAEHPDLRSMGNLPEFAMLRSAFSIPWGTTRKAKRA
jgi:hypothetical protein